MHSHKVLNVIGTVAILFLVFPLIFIIITSFGTGSTIEFPIKGFTFNWYLHILDQPDMISGLETSLLVSFIASAFGLLIGIPAVYAMFRGGIHHTAWFQMLFLSPTFLPEVVIGFSLYQGLIITLHWPMMISLIVGYFLLGFPFVIRLVGAGLNMMDPHMEEAAWISGCSRLKGFFKIVLPNIKSSIAAAFIFSFINSFNSIPVTLFLSGPGFNMLPTSILNYMQENYDPTISAISVILMLITTLIMMLINHFMGLNRLLK
ncbi:spermidine/putrescine ABC transporter permease [Philodulcilactobacillus myokoensis]|uniref:Spermidine/putrescine ABC transporter permease n=2 Tax=Philodulcilactobacillus myokoensis TaxID=2929573 RepID=A0A9W6ERM6_9LACO|nr:ABC transporter permease [Philodulcilactobacillus myokoensis]GLB46461.1 spermidine/putrescine ABC transporter permease [Philodulcilactobacillus myokoensis]